MLKTIALAIWEQLKPLVSALMTAFKDAGVKEIQEEVPKLSEEAVKIIREKMSEYLPALVKAVALASVQTGTKIAEQGIDKITDMIPGQLDDQIIDPVAHDVLGRIASEFGHLFDPK